MPPEQQELLRALPSITDLLKSPAVAAWLRQYPPPLVTGCLRQALADSRRAIQNGAGPFLPDSLLEKSGQLLRAAGQAHVRQAINATGIILHTGLGRAAIPPGVVESLLGELTGYCTLAVDRQTNERVERDQLLEYLLTELTGAEAATVVNNNAAATLLVLAALAPGQEVIVSRGQLIEIGGSFRLPDVMAQSGARLVEVGTTNRTHLKDYQKALTENTAAILRVHPSNYRVIGFTSEVPLAELADLARGRNLLLLDDLGAGALVDLAPFGLPHEPTVRESLAAGADLVFFSGDKLIGAGQCGIVVGRKKCIDVLRRHPLMRALRVDKTCLMMLERTLQLFRRPERLPAEHPTYRMMSTPLADLRRRAAELLRLIALQAPSLQAEIADSDAFLGSGSLPTEAIPSVAVALASPTFGADDLARRLRLDAACIFGRIARERVWLDLRTVTDEQVPRVAAALGRITA